MTNKFTFYLIIVIVLDTLYKPYCSW